MSVRDPPGVHDCALASVPAAVRPTDLARSCADYTPLLRLWPGLSMDGFMLAAR